MPSLMMLLWLAQTPEEDAAPAAETVPTTSAERWHWLTRGEAATLVLLPRGRRPEGFMQVEPTLVVDGGEEFGLNMGTPVRLRLWGGEAGAEEVRREDWDSLSDWGQWVRALKLGGPTSPVALWVGALEGYSLLSGHLVRRYSNWADPDSHPAGAFLTGTLGPLYVEAFASDVLSARLTGAQAEVDLAHVVTRASSEPGRYTLGLSAVRDWGRAGGGSPPVMLAHVDGTASRGGHGRGPGEPGGDGRARGGQCGALSRPALVRGAGRTGRLAGLLHLVG